MVNEELKYAVSKIMVKELDILEKWIDENREDLPQEVINIISRGKSETERIIRGYRSKPGY
jgi:hypothetical protein